MRIGIISVESVCLSVCGYNFSRTTVKNFTLSLWIHHDHIVGHASASRSLSQVTFVCFYSSKTHLKDQGHLKVKVKVIKYQGQMKGNYFFCLL